MIKRLILTCILFIVGASFALALPLDIKNGDLVFRDGDEIISDIIKQVDNSGFSHVGMIWISEEKGIQVIHSTPSEHADIKDGVTVDSLDFFISRAKPNTVRFYRINSSDEARKIAVKSALDRVGENFSIYQGQGVYCTELVVEAWSKAGVTINRGTRKLEMPIFSEREFIFPANLISSENVILSQDD
ncbi:YiiX/YebB-like N1pC/P60 family cysteine hydrolase [Proteus myxofaciens]|uniref:YiiX/YebB-like N1pC/P60 family cysteine hydrolase n=1 Tax=Proteus myxofaciens TaxID=184072 RepID=UPI0008370E75|nr:YiiX/YebB-like N1pC/P60 family cysteine hydrolase [Proteus myxofaciens]